MHSEKVPYYILDLLQQVPSVYVQGLGRFDAIFHPAVIDLHQSQIKPPYIQPDFIAQTGSESDILPAYMHYVSGIDINEAKETITSFVNDVLHHIGAGESYNIEKFGTFSKSASDVLHFTPDWDAFNLSFGGLEIIDLHPEQDLKPSESFAKPPITIPDIIQPSLELVEESPTETSLVTDHHIDLMVSSTHEETISSGRPDISESTSRLAWIILTSALLLITVLCAYLAWDIISDRKRINQLTQLYPDTLVITNEFDIPVIMDTLKTQDDSVPLTNLAEEPDTLKQPVVNEETETPCFVVVGAFTDPNNVTRMVQRLEGLGYKSAQIKGGSLTRVAISTSCDKEILQKILNEARSGINPESWIY